MSISRACVVFAVFVVLGCAPQTPRQSAACQVYQSFFDKWPAQARPHLRLVRQSLPESALRDELAPNRFAPGLLTAPPPNNIPPGEITNDTSQYFHQLRSRPVAVSDCFSEEGPTFIEASEDKRELLDRADHNISFIWTVSPVAISPDGRHALIFAEYYCGDLCAGAVYILFERQGSDWALVGHRDTWIS